MNLLLSFSDFLGQYWFIIVVFVLAIIIFVPNLLNARKEKLRRMELMNNMSKGTKVVTIFGVHGVVKSIVDKTDGYKYVIITTGDKENASTLTIRIDAIAYIDDGTSKVKTIKKVEEVDSEEENKTEDVNEEKPKTSKSKNNKSSKE